MPTTIHAIYTWARPILVEAGAEVLTRAQEWEVEWSTRCVFHTFRILLVADFPSLKNRLQLAANELITGMIKGNMARTKDTAGRIVLLAGEVVVLCVVAHLLERARRVIAACGVR